jgi:hypothetical protein
MKPSAPARSGRLLLSGPVHRNVDLEEGKRYCRTKRIVEVMQHLPAALEWQAQPFARYIVAECRTHSSTNRRKYHA